MGSTSNRRAPFTTQTVKAAKATKGRTAGPDTPLNVRTSGVNVDEDTRRLIALRVGRKLSKHALHIERTTVRLEDINGPRGGVDMACRIKVVLSNLPSVVVEERADKSVLALNRAVDAAERAVRRALGRAGMAQPKGRRRTERSKAPEAPAAEPEAGSLIGRRVGRSRANLERAASRPEKLRRDVPVDTARPERSATGRKAGAGNTAKRNTKLNEAGLTSALEDSAGDRPSRKSTRRSNLRSKRDSNLKRRETRRVQAPKARARRDQAKQR